MEGGCDWWQLTPPPLETGSPIMHRYHKVESTCCQLPIFTSDQKNLRLELLPVTCTYLHRHYDVRSQEHKSRAHMERNAHGWKGARCCPGLIFYCFYVYFIYTVYFEATDPSSLMAYSAAKYKALIHPNSTTKQLLTCICSPSVCCVGKIGGSQSLWLSQDNILPSSLTVMCLCINPQWKSLTNTNSQLCPQSVN